MTVEDTDAFVKGTPSEVRAGDHEQAPARS